MMRGPQEAASSGDQQDKAFPSFDYLEIKRLMRCQGGSP
jgi:hypothetical protein